MAKATKKVQAIVEPKDGSTCARIWAICNKHKGNRQAVLKECEQRKINPATATTQYGRWRVFTGYVKPAGAKAVKKGPPAKKVAKKGPPAKKAKAPKLVEVVATPADNTAAS